MCYGINSVVYGRLAKWLSTYQHPTQQKRPERTRHDQASSYKELCKGRATELYKEKYFPHFQEPCLLVCAFKIFGVILLFQCFTVTLTKV